MDTTEIKKLDRMRGHAFLPSEKVMASWPKLYETDGVPIAEKTVYCHWFIGNCDWWLFELDPEELMAFGYVNLGDPDMSEMGYFSLVELGTMRAPVRFHVVETIKTVGVPVERELDWEPVKWGDFKRPWE